VAVACTFEFLGEMLVDLQASRSVFDKVLGDRQFLLIGLVTHNLNVRHDSTNDI
jgi:hypothetical protein